MSKSHVLNKPILGIDQLSDETSLIHDSQKKITAIREGKNIDIDNEGNVSRRRGYTLKLSGPTYHSLYEANRKWLMACNKEELGVYEPDTNIFTPMVDMGVSYLTSFTELNGNLYAMNPGYKGMVRAEESFFRPFGIVLPEVDPSFTAIANGGLSSATYGIAYSVINDLGEESPLSALSTVVVAEQGAVYGSLFTVIPDHKYRFYMTAPNGEELYQAAEFDADSTSYVISNPADGRRPATQYLSAMPFGYIIEAHGSRLFVATDDFVYFSEPFSPHLTNEAHGFLPTTGFTSMVQHVENGVFIGDKTGVAFYKGDDPSEFEPMRVSTEVPVFGTSLAVPGSFLPEAYASADVSAIWLSESGYHIGLPSGEVVMLHSKQVALPKYVQGCTALSIQDGRKQVITPVNSNMTAGASVAFDSSTT